ncbi:MAG TPA: acetate uptake transporter [Actinospica sp.]|nr:acetate uptake transporter [Actinospica sp.]
MSTENAPVSTIADPAPLGLLGFGFTTLMLSLVNAGTFKVAEGAGLVLSLAIFYGGGAQVLAGMWEFRRGNTLGASAFTSYGAFWLVIWYWFNHYDAAGSSNAVGWFFVGWGIVTAIFTLAALKTNHALIAVFFFLTITFLFLGFGQWQAGGTFNPLNDPGLTKVGGWLGVVTGLLAWYTAAATVVNTSHKRELLPVNLKR